MAGHPKVGAHAVVMGGSIAGLLAARVLVDHFDRVTILEKDELPEGGEQRRGVPQGQHTHGLLAAGGRAICELFPGIDRELLEAGAVHADTLALGRWFFEGGMLSQMPTGFDGYLLSRPLLESIVRRRVRGIQNLTFREGVRADEPVLEGEHVVGVRVGDDVVAADLVVDARGRATRLPAWLASRGFEAPKEDRVEIGVHYTTRKFRRSKTDLSGDTAVVIPPTPDAKRGAVMLAQDGDRWTVTLVTHFQAQPPPELDAFIEFTRQLPCLDVYQVISRAEPIGDAACTSFPASVRRRYESLSRFPRGLLVIGDGICSFNPIYGQGMSTAALEALALAAVLRGGGDDVARRFFARAAKVVDMPWSIAVGSDLRIPEVTGPRSPGVAFVNWYLAKLHRAAHSDPVLSRAFLEVANLLAPPPTVMHPRYVLRVLKAHWFGDARPLNALARSSSAAGE